MIALCGFVVLVDLFQKKKSNDTFGMVGWVIERVVIESDKKREACLSSSSPCI